MPSPVQPSTEPITDSLRINPRLPFPPPKPGDTLALDLELLDDNPFQPRTEMDATKLAELAASIEQSGLLQPVAVRPAGPGRYQIVAGHRRVAAFRKLRDEAPTDSARRRYQLVRVHVVAVNSDEQMAVTAYVENAQRADLHPLEEAVALDRIRQLGNHPSAAEVAAATGQAERRVRRLLRLLVAPPVVKDAVSGGLLVEVGDGPAGRRERRRLDMMAALEFTRLFEHHARKRPQAAEERTATAIHRALSEGWSFRRIQTYVEAALSGHGASAPGEDASGGRPVAPPVCVTTPEKLVLHSSRLSGASREQLTAARADLLAALEAIDALLQAQPAA